MSRWRFFRCLLPAALAVASCEPDVALLAPETITVRGIVASAGGPVPDVIVVLVGGGADTTGADGAFEFANVTAPYTLVTIEQVDVPAQPGVVEKYVLVADGLTRPQPRLHCSSCFSPVSGSASVRVTFPLHDNERARVYLHADRGASTIRDWQSNDVVDVLLPHAGGTADGFVHVLKQSRPDATSPWTYAAIAGRPVFLLEGVQANVAFSDSDFVAVARNTVAGTVAPPSGLSNPSANVRMILDGYTLFLDAEGTAAFDFEIPEIERATYSILAGASSGALHSRSTRTVPVEPGDRAITIDLAAPPQLLSPANASSGPAPTRFEWNSGDGQGPFRLILVKRATPGPGPRFVGVITRSTRFVLPNLEEFGIAGLDPGRHTWQVVRDTGLGTVDRIFSTDPPPVADDAGNTESALFEFTVGSPAMEVRGLCTSVWRAGDRVQGTSPRQGRKPGPALHVASNDNT